MKPYVALLKGKAGEFDALKHLLESQKATITPFFDIPQRSDNTAEDGEGSEEDNEDKDAKSSPLTLDDYLRRKVGRIQRSWVSDVPFLVDFYDTDASERTSTGLHPVTAMFSLLRETEMQGIPVTGIGRDREYQTSVRDVAAVDRRGVCIRLSRDDCQSASVLATSLNELLDLIAVDRARADLILDFRQIAADEIDVVSEVVARVSSGIPKITDWRSVTFAGSSMPQSLATEVRPGTMDSIDRLEYLCWQNLKTKRLKRAIGFGDYGIVHPDLVYYDDPKKLNASATIRYTLEDRSLIARGFSLKKIGAGGFRQFYGLAKSVASRTEFMGEHFSWGDEQIERKARSSGGTGNLTTWITIGTNHHVTLVAKQLAKSG